MPKKIPESAALKTKARIRRELLYFLNLPEEFTIKDYKKAFEEKGIKITTTMPYGDMRWLEEKGKVVRLDRNENNKTTFKKVKKEDINETKSETEIEKTRTFLLEAFMRGYYYVR